MAAKSEEQYDDLLEWVSEWLLAIFEDLRSAFVRPVDRQVETNHLMTLHR